MSKTLNISALQSFKPKGVNVESTLIHNALEQLSTSETKEAQAKKAAEEAKAKKAAEEAQAKKAAEEAKAMKAAEEAQAKKAAEEAKAKKETEKAQAIDEDNENSHDYLADLIYSLSPLQQKILALICHKSILSSNKHQFELLIRNNDLDLSLGSNEHINDNSFRATLTILKEEGLLDVENKHPRLILKKKYSKKFRFITIPLSVHNICTAARFDMLSI